MIDRLVTKERLDAGLFSSASFEVKKMMVFCCPCYFCSAMCAGVMTLQMVSMLSMLPSLHKYVIEVDCFRNSDAFGGDAIARDALHHLTNCDVAKVNDSANGAYLAVGSFRVDEPDAIQGMRNLVPGQAISFLGNLSSGTLEEWHKGFGWHIFFASNNSVSAATMIGQANNSTLSSMAILGVIVALSLVGSAYCLFFLDTPRNPWMLRLLGVVAVTWLASVLTIWMDCIMDWGFFVGAAVVLACLFVDISEGGLLKLKDSLLSLKAPFMSSRLEEPLMPTDTTPSPALLEAATPEATAAIQPDQVERKTSIITSILVGMAAGLGGGACLSLGFSMLGFQ